MDANEKNQTPRDSATIVVLRDGSDGLEVLLARRNSRSRVLADTYVFPGGKLEHSDALPQALERLDQPLGQLQSALHEPQLSAEQAAALYVAAIREAAEECGLLFLNTPRALGAGDRAALCQRLRDGEALATVIAAAGAQFAASALVPWSRWITPRDAPVINRRFDTRFFLATVPEGQGAQADAFEIKETCWIKPKAALERYQNHDMALIPPQLISLMHLMRYPTASAAMHDARTRTPPLVEPKIWHEGAATVMSYPGDSAYPANQPGFPPSVPTRLILSENSFAPPQGYAQFFQSHEDRAPRA